MSLQNYLDGSSVMSVIIEYDEIQILVFFV